MCPHNEEEEECRRVVLTEKEIRARATEEVERALRYQRPLSFLVVDIGSGDAALKKDIRQAAGCSVRATDIVGKISEQEFLLIFPETGETMQFPANRALSAVLPIQSDARGGLARCPNNGMDPETLIAAARAAMEQADRGALCLLPDAVETLTFGKEDPVVIVRDEKMKRLFSLMRNLAKSDIPILILGETGTGKEVAAVAIHHWSRYHKGPFVAVNCAAVPANLLESELFGYEKGAFSGAATSKMGLIETAHTGTLFLDEIGEASMETQSKLLRVLETCRNRRIGAVVEQPVSLRIIAAANRLIDQEQDDREFRKDLYFRIGGARIEIPPLRDRVQDILPLATAFLNEVSAKQGRGLRTLSEDAAALLLSHSWPGNVRELKNAMTYVSAVTEHPLIDKSDLAPVLPKTSGKPTGNMREEEKDAPARFQKLSDEIRALEKQRIEEALVAAGGVRSRAASLIGMPLRTLVGKLKVYGLSNIGRAGSRRKTR